MAFGYCFRCGIRVSSAELDAGRAKRLPQGLCCHSCAKTLEEVPAERKERVGEPEVLSPGP